jgi:hypothetical protein
VGGQSGETPVLKKWVPGAPGTWTTINGLSAGRVYSLAVQGNDLYIGGNFTLVGSNPVKGVAKMNLSTLALSVLPPEPWNAAGAFVYAIAPNGGNQIYFGGNLTLSGTPPPPQTSQKILCLVNGSTWSTSVPAGTGLAVGGSDAAPEAKALAVDRFAGRVYVGGQFSQANGVPAINVATWNDMEYYNIANIGTLNGGTYSYGLGANNSWGVGYAQVNVTGYGFRDHAYYYQGDYYINDMGGIWGAADNSYANAINDSGTIVGYSDYYGGGVYIDAFRWTMSGGFTTLNPFGGVKGS